MDQVIKSAQISQLTVEVANLIRDIIFITFREQKKFIRMNESNRKLNYSCVAESKVYTVIAYTIIIIQS